MTLCFGIGVLGLSPTLELAEVAKYAEQFDFDSIWLSDHYALRSAFVGLPHMALATKTIKIGVGTTNPYLVNPAVFASFFGTLQETSHGRILVGLGAGDENMLQDLQIKRKIPMTTLREYIDVLQALWVGNTIKYTGQIFQTNKAALHFKLESPPPIYLAVQGPRMTQLASEIANGVLLNAAHPLDYAVAKTQLDKGFKKSGRSRNSFDIAAYSVLAMVDPSKPLRGTRKHIIAPIIAGTPKLVLERHGISQDQVTKIQNLLHKGNWTEVAKEVTPEMLDIFAIVGKPQECINRIEQLIKTGVTHIVLSPSLKPSPRQVFKNIRNNIISAFRDM